MGISAVNLQERLSSDPELIIRVMIELGFDEDKIVYHKNKGMITSTRAEEGADNPHGFIIFTDTTRYMYTTRSGSGNLFSLVMDMRNVDFPTALNLVSKWIGYKESNYVHVVHPFGGFYRKLTQNEDVLDTDLPIYDETNLPDVSSGCSKLFLDDGISCKVQEMFGDRFCHEDNAILIPIRNSKGDLVGIKARNNDKNPENGMRYWAYLPFQKTHVVYGLDINYRQIIDKNAVVVLEAEKSVQQAYDFNCKIAVATMGHNISTTQARIIKSLMTKKIILAYDEGISEEEIKEQAKKLVVDLPFFKNEVFYIYGGMLKGSKNSPTDCGKEKFQELLKHNLVRLNCGKSE